MRVLSFTLPDGSQTAWGVETEGRVTSCVTLAPTLDEFLHHDRRALEELRRFATSSTAAEYALAEVRVEAPVRPGKVVAIGQNYRDHCRETNSPIPETPIVFAKFPTSILGHEHEIRWRTDLTEKVDWEVELGVVVGQTARHVTQEDALKCVFGYTIVNDVSARDLQFGDGQWVRGKSLDTFCPIGPVIVTADEIDDPQALDLCARVNGEVMQDSNTREMIFGVRYLIEFLSRAFTLEPGDVIATGTPHGVGVGRNPQVFLRDGDVVEMEVEHIGRLRNVCRAES